MKPLKQKTKKRIRIVTIIIVALICIFLGVKAKEYLKVNSIVSSHPINQDNMQNSAENGSSAISTGVQQIMIGSLCNNYDNALQTLLNIKAAGYDGIELNSFMIHDTALVVKLMTKFAGMPIGNGGSLDWPKLIQESGLNVISLHSDLGAIESDPLAVAEEAKSFNTKYVVITGMYRFDYSNQSDVEELALRLNAAGEALSKEGIQLLYHNHNCELQKVSTDKTAYDILIENTNSDYINFEFDSYWMTDGGTNVPALMEKLGNRMKLWHINDRGYTKSGPYMTPILQENATELGNGNMDLNTLYQIAKDNGVETIILETHQNWVDGDPIESLQISANYMDSNFK